VTKSQHKFEFYREQNLECARIIAAEPERYPGALQDWARLVLNPPAERTAPIRRAA